MSKKIEVAGKSYDSRSVIIESEKLKIPNHPKINALAIPKGMSGITTVLIKLAFGTLDINQKEIRLEVASPKRIDVINEVVAKVKAQPTYRR